MRESVPVPPGCGTGILCGQPSGIIVLDIDSKDAVFPDGATFPETFTVRTGRGGAHLYYALPLVLMPASGSATDGTCKLRPT